MRDDIVLEDEASGVGLRAAQPGLMTRGLTWLSDLVFPPVCLACRVALVEHDALCPRCWGQIDFIRPPLCDRLGLPMPYDTGGTMISAAAAADPPSYDRARAVAHFSGVLRELVHDFKFSDQHAARQLLVRLMAEAGRELLRRRGPDRSGAAQPEAPADAAVQSGGAAGAGAGAPRGASGTSRWCWCVRGRRRHRSGCRAGSGGAMSGGLSPCLPGNLSRLRGGGSC